MPERLVCRDPVDRDGGAAAGGPPQPGVRVVQMPQPIPNQPSGRGLTALAPGVEAQVERVIASARLILVILGLLVLYINPPPSSRHAPIAYAAFGFYAAYAAVLLVALRRAAERGEQYWLVTTGLDIAWFGAFIYLTGGASSPFFVFFTFPVLAIATRWGFRGSIVTGVANIAAYVLASAAYAIGPSTVPIGSLVTRLLSLLTLTYLIGYLSESGHRWRNQLALVNRLDEQMHTRPDVAGVVGALLQIVLPLVDAEEAVLVLVREELPSHEFRLVVRRTESDGQFTETPLDVRQALQYPEVGTERVFVEHPWSRELAPWSVGQPAEPPPPVEFGAEFPTAHPIRSVLSVPLRVPGITIGRLYIFNNAKDRFSDADATIVTLLASRTALAIERARLYEEARGNAEFQAALAQINIEASSALELRAALQVMCREGARVFQADGGYVWLIDREAHQLEAVAGFGRATENFVGRRRPLDDTRSVAVRTLSANRAQLLTDIMDADPRLGEHSRQLGAETILTVPLYGRRRKLGVVLFTGVRVSPGTEHVVLERADLLARQISVATENTQLFEQVLRARRDWENTFNSIADLVVVCDQDLHVLHVNRALADRLRFPKPTVIDRPLADILSPEVLAWVQEIDPTRLAEGAPVTRQMPDPGLGGIFSISVSALISREGHPLGLVLVMRDMSEQVRLAAEREELRDRLSQSEKLAALGQFIAGIAHELNNPLQGVLGHLELMRVTGALPAEIRPEMNTIYREADRAAKIVRNLLAFAGRRKTARRPVSVNTLLIRALAPRLQSLKEAGIQVDREFAERLPRVMGDPVLLQQVFFNILLNAEQAMQPNSGQGRILIKSAHDPEKRVVRVWIRDWGPGISPEVLPHIFEPFFTTKPVGQGTGLGLALSYGIVQDLGGTISARNRADGGAEFTVELPVHDQTVNTTIH